MRRVYLAKISTLTETHNKEIEREQSCKKMDYHYNGLFHQFRSWTNKIDKKISTQNYTLPIWTIVKNDLIVHSTTIVKSRIFFHDSDTIISAFINYRQIIHMHRWDKLKSSMQLSFINKLNMSNNTLFIIGPWTCNDWKKLSSSSKTPNGLNFRNQYQENETTVDAQFKLNILTNQISRSSLFY